MSAIPAIQEAEIRSITVQGQPGSKVCETPPQSIKLGMVRHMCHPNYIWAGQKCEALFEK
jgi:hypothetical protein